MPPEPSEPDQFIFSLMMYLPVGAVIHLLLLAGILVLVLPITFCISRSSLLSCLKVFSLGVLIMYIVGLGGHFYWSLWVWNTIYYSPDYVIDFWMFIPASGYLMDPAGFGPGHLIGSHVETDIYSTWIAASSCCWIAWLILFYALVLRRHKKRTNKPVDATARSPVVSLESPAPTHHL